MKRRSNFLLGRRLGLILATLVVLAGLGAPWPPAESWAPPSGGAGADPSQVRLLPAKLPPPVRYPFLLPAGGHAISDALTALSPRDTPAFLVSLFVPRPETSPTGSARRAAVASKASVLNRIRLQAHAPPALL